jgi:hypothetical protein
MLVMLSQRVWVLPHLALANALPVGGVGNTVGDATKGVTDTAGGVAKGAGGAVSDTTSVRNIFGLGSSSIRTETQEQLLLIYLLWVEHLL